MRKKAVLSVNFYGKAVGLRYIQGVENSDSGLDPLVHNTFCSLVVVIQYVVVAALV